MEDGGTWKVAASIDDIFCPSHGAGKTVETTPDKKTDLKRSSLKEKWGLHLAYQITEARLQLTVTKVL